MRERREREQGGYVGTKRSREEAGTSRACSQMSEFIYKGETERRKPIPWLGSGQVEKCSEDHRNYVSLLLVSLRQSDIPS